MSICLSCGIEFKSKHHHKNAKYCSYECSYVSKRKNQKICPICGKTFFASTTRQRSCSISCGNELVRRKLSIPCLCCGRTFLPRHKKQRFCGRECRRAYLIAAKKKPCHFCGKDFIAQKSDDVFCSRDCCNNSFRRITGTGDKKCVRCGTSFFSRKRNSAFCSDACRIKTNKDLRRFKAIEQGEICKSISIASVGARDGWRCGICGKIVESGAEPNSNGAPSIDHIIPISRGGSHSWGNVQIAHRLCNSRKSAKIAPMQLRLEIEMVIYG